MAISNDALMAKLFKWTTTVEYNGVKFYQRIVGDSVIDDARREALLESRKLRRELCDTDSSDYLIYLDPLEDLDDTELRESVIIVAMRDIMREYLQNTPRPAILELPDNPSQELQEEYEAAHEEREKNYLADMTAHVDNWRVDFEKTLEGKDRNMIMGLAKKYRVDQACEDRFTQVFEDHVVCASIYADDKYKTRMFMLEQYKELPAELK